MILMSLFTIIFGFVFWYPLLIFLRFMTGVCNPLPIIVKPYIANLVGQGDDKNKERKRALGYYSNFNSFGLIIGNMIGGTFARPYNTKLFGVISSTNVLSNYPFILPNVIIGVFGLLLAAIVIMFLPE
jgi:MFS family permease